MAENMKKTITWRSEAYSDIADTPPFRKHVVQQTEDAFSRLLLREARRQKDQRPSDLKRLQVVPVVFNVKNFDLFFIDRWNVEFRNRTSVSHDRCPCFSNRPPSHGRVIAFCHKSNAQMYGVRRVSHYYFFVSGKNNFVTAGRSNLDQMPVFSENSIEKAGYQSDTVKRPRLEVGGGPSASGSRSRADRL